MTGKLKRYISLDILRGIAVIGMFSFHLLTRAYNYNAVLDGDPTILFYFNLIWLAFVGEFDVLFTGMSATVNIISIDRKWASIMDHWDGDAEEGRKQAFRSILKVQLIRGAFIMLCAYISEVLLNHMLLYSIMGLPDIINEAMKMMFRSHILWLIGLGLILTSVSYLLMKRANWSRKKMIWSLIIIATVSLFIITPFLQWLYPALGFPNRPGNEWETTSFGKNILRILIAPIIQDDFPLFPDVSVMFIGVIIGFLISTEKVEKKTLDRLLITSAVMFIVGLLIYLGEVAMFGTLNTLNIKVNAGTYLMRTAGSIWALVLFLYLFDIQRGRKPVKFFFFQRFGTMALSLWMLQWVMAFPLMLIQLRLNFRTHAYDWSSFVPLRDGILFTKGLTGWQVTGEIAYIIAFWALFLWVWQQVKFVGSFEWITMKLMSIGKGRHARANISDAIVNVESLSDPPQKFYKVGLIISFFVIFFVFCVIFTLTTLLLFPMP